jgi:hypothetical protein
MVIALPMLVAIIGLQVACAPTDITVNEAKNLAIHAASVGDNFFRMNLMRN